MTLNRSAEEVFDSWALDYHAPGMEDEHWPSVREAFELIPESSGQYLEVGVGNGYGLFHIATNQYRTGHCLGIDVSANMVDVTLNRVIGLENVAVRHTDLLNLQSSDVTPDFIFSMEVFYYLPDIALGIEHAFDLLAPGGTLMILVNFYQEHIASNEWPAQLDTRMQRWSCAEYSRGMEAAGFVDVKQAFFNAPSDPASREQNPGTLGTWGKKPE